jgi:hypothetical protein
MRTFIVFIALLPINLICLAQEIEFCSSINTSSEQRFMNAYGIGIQYQQKILSKYQLGLGLHFKKNETEFDYNSITDVGQLYGDHINSDSRIFSIRINVQRIIKENESILLTLGPEMSCNFLWGQDMVNMQYPSWTTYIQDLHSAKKIGYGLIAKTSIKNLLIKRLDLVFTIMPEIYYSKVKLDRGGDDAITYFPQYISFVEFQIGLKYRINN